MMSLPLLFYITLFCFISRINTEKTPSLGQIKNLKNDDLDEIFGSTVTKTAVSEQFPEVRPQMELNRFNTGPSSQREVVINHGHALGPQMPSNNEEFQQIANQGANVLATGATAFYRGAASVGEAFGIPTSNYQVPLFSQAASLFG